MSGTIPATLGGLANLEELSLNGNELSGTIPATLGNLTNLEELSLNGNTLSGAIPVELGGLTNLDDLDFAGNTLSGAMPVELGGLANLQRLSLADNELSGAIPHELANLTRLGMFDIRNTGLCVPAELSPWIATIRDFRDSGATCQPDGPEGDRAAGRTYDCDPRTGRPSNRIVEGALGPSHRWSPALQPPRRGGGRGGRSANPQRDAIFPVRRQAGGINRGSRSTEPPQATWGAAAS